MKASENFGGCTLLDSFGYWVDNGKLYVDDSYRLVIDFNFDQDTVSKLLSLIKMELISGEQEAVCFSINGVTSISNSVLEAQKDLNEMFGLNSKKVLTK